MVQVEKRPSRDDCFGQSRTKTKQVLMTIKQLLKDKFKFQSEKELVTDTTDDDDNDGDDDSGDLYYLSTQQPPSEDEEEKVVDDDDNDDDNDDKKIPAKQRLLLQDKFQVPCLQLLQSNLISDTLPWAGNLILESCNLWMGQCTSSTTSTCTKTTISKNNGQLLRRDGSCSGLHHDFHDNFYLLFKGRKEFRLYSPNVAYDMETFGKIDKMHPNGVISYVGNETRSDGIPYKLLEEKDEAEEEEEAEDDVDDDGEEEELVLGKGFDYVSSSEEEEEEGKDDDDDGAPASKRVKITNGGSKDDDDDFDAVDDYDEMILADQQKKENNGDEKDGDGKAPPKRQQQDVENERRPNHFSRIGNPADPTTATKFPKFVERSPECVVVVLKAGQSLYLPAGWFHSVTSMGSDDADEDDGSSDGIHMAINYWYHPPDNLDNFENPYQHDDLAKMQ